MCICVKHLLLQSMQDCNFIDNIFMESVYDSNLDTHWLPWMINLCDSYMVCVNQFT